MKKVYVVIWVFEHPYMNGEVQREIEKIFSSLEKAKEWAVRGTVDEGVTYEVEEWEVE